MISANTNASDARKTTEVGALQAARSSRAAVTLTTSVAVPKALRSTKPPPDVASIQPRAIPKPHTTKSNINKTRNERGRVGTRDESFPPSLGVMFQPMGICRCITRLFAF